MEKVLPKRAEVAFASPRESSKWKAVFYNVSTQREDK